MAEYDGQLYVGGSFWTAGGDTAIRIARWDGSAWSSFGATVDGNVRNLLVYDGELYASGNFYHVGAEVVGGIAKWDGVNWSAVGNQPFSGGINSMAIYNDELYVGGFVGIFKWNGTTWSTVGFDGSVNALAVYEGELYATGGFISPYNGIAKYNGSNWSAVGGSGSGGGIEGYPKALASYNGSLYVGGLLFSVDGLPFAGIAKWNGTTWSSVGGGLNNDVNTFFVNEGLLYAGGRFTRAGTNQDIVVSYLGVWDGSIWFPVGLFGANWHVHAIATYIGCLYVGGAFNRVDWVYLDQIARWCGPVGIASNAVERTFNIYPNPTDGNFNIRLNAWFRNGRVEVINILGEVVYTASAFGSDISFSLEHMPAGTYFVTITAGREVLTKKLFIH